MRIRILRSRPREQYLKPTADEVAALIVGGEDAAEMVGDIIVRKLDGNLQMPLILLIWLYNIYSYFRMELIVGEWEFLLLAID